MIAYNRFPSAGRVRVCAGVDDTIGGPVGLFLAPKVKSNESVYTIVLIFVLIDVVRSFFLRGEKRFIN